jgi:SAM-dependent methyltransferase
LIKLLKRFAQPVVAALFPTAFKHHSELSYWRSRFNAEKGSLSNSHYEPLYTTVYDLTRDDYTDKAVIDIGCGPRGSLEWATMAAERVGLDPLADQYLKLGASKHAMKYVTAPSENIPFPDGYFDIVTCLNALDHVDKISETIAEIKRVTRKGGFFLVSVEIDHLPTPMEPLVLTERDMDQFLPEFEILLAFTVGTPEDHHLHTAVLHRQPPYEAGKPGIYVAKMKRL